MFGQSQCCGPVALDGPQWSSALAPMWLADQAGSRPQPGSPIPSPGPHLALCHHSSSGRGRVNLCSLLFSFLIGDFSYE